MVSRNYNYDFAEFAILKTKMVKLVQRRLVIEEIGYSVVGTEIPEKGRGRRSLHLTLHSHLQNGDSALRWAAMRTVSMFH